MHANKDTLTLLRTWMQQQTEISTSTQFVNNDILSDCLLSDVCFPLAQRVYVYVPSLQKNECMLGCTVCTTPFKKSEPCSQKKFPAGSHGWVDAYKDMDLASYFAFVVLVRTTECVCRFFSCPSQIVVYAA